MESDTRPVKVLDLRDSPWVDGPGRTVLDCAEMMDPSQCQIIVAAFDGGNSDGTAYEIEARNRGLVVERIRERRSADINVLRQILSIARKYNVDILHAHDFRTDLFGLAAKLILRIPMVSTVHGWIENDLKTRMSVNVDKLILRSVEHVISVSNDTRMKLGEWATEQRCTVIPNALRIENYQCTRGDSLFRKTHDIAEHEIVIANIGRLSPEKGQLQFLLVARELLKKYDDIRIVIIGIGPDQDRLEQFVSENGFEDKAIFAGYRTDMNDVYKDIDLVVQSSFTEGMPNVILEALLMEVPVIATDVGGTKEVIVDGKTGVLVEPGDLDALLSAIKEFLKNRSIHKKKAIEGRKDIIERFDHSNRVSKLQNVYQAIVNKASE